MQLLCGLAIILVVLFQSGKSEGLSGAIGGVADSFLAKNKARTMDAKLARATKWVGAVFLILDPGAADFRMEPCKKHLCGTVRRGVFFCRKGTSPLLGRSFKGFRNGTSPPAGA